jgi:hypothetical protein
MANVNLTKIRLTGHGWPAPANVKYGPPTDGFDNTVENFNTADDTAKALDPPVPVGEQRISYSDATAAPGWYRCMYLGYHSFESAAVSADFSDGQFWCAAYEGSDSVHSDTSTTPYYVVTNEFTAINSDVTKGGRICIPCSTSIGSDGTTAATNGYGDGWGWFLIEGVMPVQDVTLLQGTAQSLNGADITVDAGAGLGPLMAEVSGGDVVLSSTDLSNVNDATLGAQGPTPMAVAYADQSAT